MDLQNETDREMRKKIIDTARKLAEADGLFNLSAKEISESLKIPGETFYKFFKEIDELIAELLTTRSGLADENILKLPVDEKIRKFNFTISMQVETAGVEKFTEWLHDNVQKRENRLISSDKEILRKILTSSVENGELISDTPIEELVDFILSLNYGMGIYWSMSDAKFEPLEHLDTFNDFIINALIPYLIK